MNILLLMLLTAVSLGALYVFIKWYDRCERCESWRTEEVYSSHHDEHNPGGKWEKYHRHCRTCGHRYRYFEDFVIEEKQQ